MLPTLLKEILQRIAMKILRDLDNKKMKLLHFSDAGIIKEDSFMRANVNGFNDYNFNENEKEHFRYVARERQNYINRVKRMIIDNLAESRKDNRVARARLKDIPKYEEALGMHWNGEDEEWEKL